MRITTVTFTGADDSITPLELVDLTNRYNFVEWGILLSASSEGSSRFPSLSWLESLDEVNKTFLLPLSGHICGRWVRNICKGLDDIWHERPVIGSLFRRLQLNFHQSEINGNMPLFGRLLKKFPKIQFIFQVDGINQYYFDYALNEGVDAVPLFDKSGGAGIVPQEWPKPIDNVLCGYAGGLSQENLEEELARIHQVAGDRDIWIDFETRVRSNDDRLFDLKKVEKCLEIAKAYI